MRTSMCLVVLFTVFSSACGKEDPDPEPTPDAGGDASPFDASSDTNDGDGAAADSDTQQDVDGASGPADMGPPGDIVVNYVAVVEEVDGYYLDWTATNAGEGEISMETCEWSIRRVNEQAIEESGTFSPIGADDLPTGFAYMSYDAIDLEPSPDNGTVEAELTLTCLPPAGVSEVDSSNNSESTTFDW